MFLSNAVSAAQNVETEMHPTFAAWLQAERADPEDDEAVLKDIQEGLFPLLQFHRFHVNQDDCLVYFNLLQTSLMFENGHRVKDLSSNSGDCSELAGRMVQLVWQKYPELVGKFLLVEGKEPDYFRAGELSSRHFLGVLARDGQLSMDSLVADPALQKVGRAGDLGYLLGQVRDLNGPSTFGRLPWPSNIVWAMPQDQRLLYLAWDRAAPTERGYGQLIVGIQEPESSVDFLSVAGSDWRSELAGEDRVIRETDSFHEKFLRAQPPWSPCFHLTN